MLAWLKAAFWLACVAVAGLSLAPTSYLSPTVFDWWDKGQHVLAFAILYILGSGFYPERRRIVLVGLLAFGAGIEVAQAATSWRYGDLGDWLADAVGLGIGVMSRRFLNPTSPTSRYGA